MKNKMIEKDKYVIINLETRKGYPSRLIVRKAITDEYMGEFRYEADNGTYITGDISWVEEVFNNIDDANQYIKENSGKIIESKIFNEKLVADPTEAKRIQELSPDTYAILYGWRYKYQDPVEISPEEYDDDESLNIRLNQIMKDYNRYSMKDSKGNRYINKSDFKFYILYNKNKSTIYENLNLDEALSVLKKIE